MTMAPVKSNSGKIFMMRKTGMVNVVEMTKRLCHTAASSSRDLLSDELSDSSGAATLTVAVSPRSAAAATSGGGRSGKRGGKKKKKRKRKWVEAAVDQELYILILFSIRTSFLHLRRTYIALHHINAIELTPSGCCGS